MVDTVKLLEDMVGLIKQGRFADAQNLIDNEPGFSSSYPVIKKLVSNKREIVVRDSIIDSSDIVQQDIDTVKDGLGLIEPNLPVMGMSAIVGKLECSLSSERVERTGLYKYLKEKVEYLSGLDDGLYPERKSDVADIKIQNSVIENSSIVQNNIAEMKNYFVIVEGDKKAAGDIASLGRFCQDFQDQLDSMKDIYSEQRELMVVARDHLRGQDLSGALRKMQGDMRKKNEAIAHQSEEILRLKDQHQQLEDELRLAMEEKVAEVEKQVFRAPFDPPTKKDVRSSPWLRRLWTISAVVCFFGAIFSASIFEDTFETSPVLLLVLYGIVITSMRKWPFSYVPYIEFFCICMVGGLTIIDSGNSFGSHDDVALPIIFILVIAGGLLSIRAAFLFADLHALAMGQKVGKDTMSHLTNNYTEHVPGPILFEKVAEKRHPAVHAYLVALGLNLVYLILFFTAYGDLGNDTSDEFFMDLILLLSMGGVVGYNVLRLYRPPANPRFMALPSILSSSGIFIVLVALSSEAQPFGDTIFEYIIMSIVVAVAEAPLLLGHLIDNLYMGTFSKLNLGTWDPRKKRVGWVKRRMKRGAGQKKRSIMSPMAKARAKRGSYLLLIAFVFIFIVSQVSNDDTISNLLLGYNNDDDENSMDVGSARVYATANGTTIIRADFLGLNETEHYSYPIDRLQFRIITDHPGFNITRYQRSFYTEVRMIYKWEIHNNWFHVLTTDIVPDPDVIVGSTKKPPAVYVRNDINSRHIPDGVYCIYDGHMDGNLDPNEEICIYYNIDGYAFPPGYRFEVVSMGEVLLNISLEDNTPDD